MCPLLLMDLKHSIAKEKRRLTMLDIQRGIATRFVPLIITIARVFLVSHFIYKIFAQHGFDIYKNIGRPLLICMPIAMKRGAAAGGTGEDGRREAEERQIRRTKDVEFANQYKSRARGE